MFVFGLTDLIDKKSLYIFIFNFSWRIHHFCNNIFLIFQFNIRDTDLGILYLILEDNTVFRFNSSLFQFLLAHPPYL
jgi:hypothetical protein